MADDREPLGRIAHEAYGNWLLEQGRLPHDAVHLNQWERLAPGLQEAYMRIGSAVAARAVADIAARLEHAEAALAGDNEGVRLWMLDCGELVAKHRDRADSADARLAEIRQVIKTYFVVHGNSTSASLTHARDLAEGIRQILDRKPAP